MVRLVLIFSVILLFQTIGFGQDVCVEIKTESNAYIFPSGQTILFKAVLSEKIKAENLKFIWNTSNGISKTENSDSFSLETKKDSKAESIEITLKVEGLPNNCLKSYEDIIFIRPPSPPPIVDWNSYPKDIPWNKEKELLFSVANALEFDKNSVAYIIIDTKNPKDKKLLNRQQKIMNFLTKKLNFGKERVKVIIRKSDFGFEQTSYQILSKDTQPPINKI